jgi:hypothetical protein
MLCAVCTIHKETRSTGFLVEPQNQGRRVSRFGPQNRQLRFRDLCLKTKRVKVCRLRHKTNGEEDGAGHALRSSGLHRLEASQVRIFQFASKLMEE